MSWPAVPLGKVFEIARGGSPRPIDKYITDDPDGLNWVKIGDATASGKYIRSTKEKIRKEGLSKTRAVEPGDFLLTNSMSFGRPYIMGTHGCIHDGWLVLKPRRDDTVSQDYMYHVLGSNEIKAGFASRAPGSTVKNLNSTMVAETSIPLPPLEDQRRIAEILDAADALRRRRREALALLDTLPGAIFAEMFIGESAEVSRFKLSELGKVSTGATPPSKLDGMFDGEIPFVTPGDLDTTDPVVRSVTEAGVQKSRTVSSGATLVSCIGNVGKIRQVTETVAFNQQINAIEWSEKVIPEYGTEAIRFIKDSIQNAATSTTLPILKKSLFQAFEIPCPDRCLQEKFSERVAMINVQRDRMLSHLAEVDALFASLQSRAFAGDL